MFISLGYLSLQMIIPLLIPVLYSIRHYLLEEFDKNLKGRNNEEKHQSVFLNTFLISISYSINCFLLIIEYKKTKSTRKKIIEKEFDNQLLIEKIKIEKKQKKYKLLCLILLSLFNFVNLLSYDIINIFKPSDYNKNFFYTLSIPIFFIITAFMSYLFLNYNIYIHQKLSMLISPLLSLSLLIILILFKSEQKNKSMYSILFLIECLGLRSLRYILDVLGKLLMDKMFITHVKLMVYLGIFGIIFSLIVNSLSYLVNLNFIENPDFNDYFIIKKNSSKRFKNIFDNWGYFDKINRLLLIGNIIIWFGENYIKWFCIYTFSPNHYAVYASINPIIIIFIELVVKQFNLKYLFLYIFSLIALCGIFLCGLIFNEILILRFCNLDQFTKVEINKRQKKETQISMVRYNNSNNNNNENPDNSFDTDNMSDKNDDRMSDKIGDRLSNKTGYRMSNKKSGKSVRYSANSMKSEESS